MINFFDLIKFVPFIANSVILFDAIRYKYCFALDVESLLLNYPALGLLNQEVPENGLLWPFYIAETLPLQMQESVFANHLGTFFLPISRAIYLNNGQLLPDQNIANNVITKVIEIVQNSNPIAPTNHDKNIAIAALQSLQNNDDFTNDVIPRLRPLLELHPNYLPDSKLEYLLSSYATASAISYATNKLIQAVKFYSEASTSSEAFEQFITTIGQIEQQGYIFAAMQTKIDEMIAAYLTESYYVRGPLNELGNLVFAYPKQAEATAYLIYGYATNEFILGEVGSGEEL
jgi:hypothetical protein